MEETPTKEKKKIVICEHASYASLTVGKSYKVLDEHDNKYVIINDNHEKKSYYKNRFNS